MCWMFALLKDFSLPQFTINICFQMIWKVRYVEYYSFLKIIKGSEVFRNCNQGFVREFILQARDHTRDVFSYPQDDSSTHMESYMEYLSLLNHRHAQEPVNESSSTEGSNADVVTNESLFLLTNTTNSLSFGVISSINDENGDHNDDDNNRLNESENNNDVTDGSSTQVNEFSDVELVLFRDLYSPSASDRSAYSEQRESAQSEGFANSLGETVQGGSFRLSHLMQRDLNSSNESDIIEGNNGSFQNPIHHDSSLSARFRPQPLKLPSSTRLKMTVLKWNIIWP